MWKRKSLVPNILLPVRVDADSIMDGINMRKIVATLSTVTGTPSNGCSTNKITWPYQIPAVFCHKFSHHQLGARMLKVTFWARSVRLQLSSSASKGFPRFQISILYKICFFFDVCLSVHHSTIHKEKSYKMQQCIEILFLHIYMKLNMFRATHRLSSGA
jgi:hypothetical protein